MALRTTTEQAPGEQGSARTRLDRRLADSAHPGLPIGLRLIDSILNRERPAEMQEIQSTICTRCDFDRKVIRYDRIAQHGGGPYHRYDGPGQNGWEWNA